MNNGFKPRVTLFHCINGIGETSLLPLTGRSDVEVRVVNLPCSSLVKPVHLLKEFEAGVDGVAVLACPEGQCRYVNGSVRAGKRVERVRKLLDEIGLDGRRLFFFSIVPEDEAAIEGIMDKMLDGLAVAGPNPAVLVT